MMMNSEQQPSPILYASVSNGTTILAEHDASGGGLGALAVRCLEAAPKFHLLYSHTASNRIYAFLTMDESLLFFAIADEAVGPAKTLNFLRRLRDGFNSSAVEEEFLRVLRRLVEEEEEDKKPPPPPPPPPSSPPSVDTQVDPDDGDKENRRGGKKGKARKNKEEEEESVASSFDHDAAAAAAAAAALENRMEISVVDRDHHHDSVNDPLREGRKSAQIIWRQHVRMVLLIDLVVCTLLFGIWLLVCRGFHCIAS